MQLELGARAAGAPRVLALCFPDLALQRVLRGREAARAGRARADAPLAVEREGRIVACDPEARARGVRPGDALVQARAACAALEVVPADDGADRAELEAAAEALLAVAPAVEIAPPDCALLDASGAHLLGDGAAGERALVARAVAIAAGLGLRCRAALADGRAPARALALHGGAAEPVAAGDVAAALAPLPLAALGLTARLAERLAAVGLRTAGDLARLPGESLAHRFGAEGLQAWRRARGDDPSPLVPFAPLALPREALDLDGPAEAAEAVLFALKRLCDRAAVRLGGRGLGAVRLGLALRLDPRGEERLAVALARPSTAAARWLLVLRERVSELRLPGAVTGIVLSVEEAAPAPREQLALGDSGEQLAALDAVLARLTARLGDEALFAAAPVDRHRPERAYRAAPFTGASRSGAAAGAATSAAPADGRDPASPAAGELARPTRLLAAPLPLVALGDGGRLTAVRLGGRSLRVLELSAPERLEGEWWTEPFAREYRRARLEELGACWIYRDAADGRLWLHGFFD
jgi:protein ImuB